MQVQISADKSQFTVSGTMTDNNGIQHLLNAKMILDFYKQSYKIRLSSIPNEVIESPEFIGSMSSMFAKIRTECTSLLESYLLANGSGKQLDLFGSPIDDQDGDELSEAA